MRIATTIPLLTALLAVLPVPAEADMIESPGRLRDAREQFDRLAHQGEWLGYHTDGAPTTVLPLPLVYSDQHYQGIARSPRVGGPPVLYVTRSGEAGGLGNTGTLQVIVMGSRDGSGERMRSNRLARSSETQSTIANAADGVVRVIPFDYGHPGGMQMCGDVLAVPLEAPDPYFSYLPEGRVAFFDCQQPDNPVQLDYTLDLEHDVGVVGLTRLADGHFLLVAAWGDSTELEFHRSTATSFAAPDFAFELHDRLLLPDLMISGYWRTGKTSPQTLNLLVQDDGRVFMMGSSHTDEYAPFVRDEDLAYLWEVRGWGEGEEVTLHEHRQRPIELYSAGDLGFEPIFDRQEANFNAGAGAYVTPTGQLLYYAVEYYNQGPGGATRFAEIHRIDMTETGTCGPQLRPNHLGGPHGIPEGSSLRLEGRVTFIEPWVTMFSEPDFRGRMLTIDALAQDRDDHDDFEELDGPWSADRDGFSDDMESYLFCAEPGTSLLIFDDDSWRRGDTDTIVRAGTGRVVEVHDVGDDVRNQATSARFVRPWPGPVDAPWTPPVRAYEWDLDGDGTFESPGIDGGHAALFTAGLGGTSTPVAMRIGGVVATTRVDAVNVPPTVALAAFPPALEGGVVRAGVTWSDAVPGPHELSVRWGDGTTTTTDLLISSGGSRSEEHVYADDGDYVVRACVSDGIDTTCRQELAVVRNAAPALRPLAVDAGAEGAVIRFTLASFTDAGTLDTHEVTVDWGDGSPIADARVTETPFGPPGSTSGLVGSFEAQHVFADDGDFDVRACVEDDDGGSACATVRATIRNARPTIVPLAPLAADEGTVVRLEAPFNDPGTRDEHVATLEWGDGTPAEPAVVTESPFGPPGSTDGLDGTASGEHVFADDGTYVVRACVTDDDGATTCATTDVVVRNVAPIVRPQRDLAGVEGSLVTLSALAFHDAGTLDTHSVSIHWGDELPAVAARVVEAPYGPPGDERGMDGMASSSHVYGDDGSYDVLACVTDDDGATGCGTFRVGVANVDPSVALDETDAVAFPGGAAFLVRSGTPASWSATANDAGSDDIVFEWTAVSSDGSSGTVDEGRACNDPTGATCPDPPRSSQSHHFPMLASWTTAARAFDVPGVLDLRLVATDDDGGGADSSAVVLVTGTESCGRGLGGWKHQLDHDAQEVARLLEVVAFASPSFPELACADGRDASCLATAARMALDGTLPGDARRARAWRAGVAAWLDFASGAVGWQQEISPSGLAFSELIGRVETALADPDATSSEVAEAERLAHSVNESARGRGGCGRN